MVKEASKVIEEFNELVNMTADELKQWLNTEDSKTAGWTGGSGEGGETVGHDSGNKIVKILESNPDKKEDKYAEEDIDHMRKVVSYCKRHLAQESSMAERKSEDELKQTKSYKSLKNWGHDSLKQSSKAASKKEDKSGEEEQKGDKKDNEDKKEEEESPAAGDKRKADEAKDEEDQAKEEEDAPESKKAKEDESAKADEKEKEETEQEDEASAETGEKEK
jgi:hypothetical protein